jgi:hypothetical protein
MEAFWAERVRGHPLVEVFGSGRVLLRGVTLDDAVSVALGVRHSRLAVVEGLALHNYVADRSHVGILVENSDVPPSPRPL